MKRKIFIYAFDDMFRIVDWAWVYQKATSVKELKAIANDMRVHTHGRSIQVFAIDNHDGLREGFYSARRAVTDHAKRYEFYDYVFNEGVPL